MTYSRIAAVALPVALAGALGLGLYARHLRSAPVPPARPATPAHRPASDREAAFDAIYANAAWGKNAEGVGNSGHGSTLDSTIVYRAYLQRFLAENSIRSVVDAGCGDWESTRAIDWSGIDYKGYDIVPAVIEADQRKYTRDNVHFFTADIVDTELPPADLLIVKHVLQHLPTADVQRFLLQLPKYKHVLFTDGVNPETLSASNGDIVPGAYRELDLLRPPFNVRGRKVLLYWDGMHMHQVVHATPQAR